MGNTEEGQLRKYIEITLESILPKFRVESFESYLANLQQSRDLKIFIDDLYNNMAVLRLKSADILQLLKKIGSNPSIKEGFGYNYFALWLQFLLIDEINIQNRISRQEIQKLSKSRNKDQLEALQDICYACGSSATEQEIRKILEEIQEDQLFKEMIQVKEQVKIHDLKESKLKWGKKSNLSDLNSKQRSSVFLIILDKIFQRIGAVNKIQDFQETLKKIADLINDILLRTYSTEREVLNCHLNSAIFNQLGIQIKTNNCIVHEQTTDVIKQRFQNFQKFFYFQKSLISFDHQQLKIVDILDKMKSLLRDGMKNLWYWPTYDKKSFIVFIIEKSVQMEQIDSLVQIFNTHTPNMTAHIFDINEREFLEQILTQTPKQVSLAKVIKCLQKYAKNQNIDLEKELKSGRTYRELLQSKGLPFSHIQNWSEIVPVSKEDYFYIYCYKTKKRQQLYINLEHRDELFDKCKDLKFHQSVAFTSKGYSLDCALTDKMTIGNYQSGKLNPQFRYRSNVEFNGILNYGNLRKFQHLVKEFKWMILLSEKWEQIKFDAKENEHITEQIMRNIKGQEKIFKMRLGTGILVEINLQTMTINELINSSKSPNQSSMMKHRYGYLIYFLAYKAKNNSLIMPDLSDDELESPIQTGKESQSQQTLPQYEKQQTLDKTFQFLGVFWPYFQVDHYDFTIDKNENVLASTKTIHYFQNWFDIELYSLMDQHVMEKGKKIFISKQYFKLSKKLYPKFKEEIKICQQKMTKTLNLQYKNQNLTIVNLKQEPQSIAFYQALMKYLTLKITKQCQKKGFTLEVTKDQRDYLLKQQKIKVVDLQNTTVQMVCTKQQRQKLLKEVAALDQTHQFTYEDPAAYKLMKQKEAKYLKQIYLVENQIGQNTFRVSMKLKNHPTFKQKLLQYHIKIEKQGGQNIQRKMEKEGQFLHIYKSEFGKQNIQIGVTKVGKNDLLLQYKKRVQKAVNKVLSKINEAKQRQFFKIAKGKSRQYVFTNVQIDYIYKLKEKLAQILNKTAKMPINAIIDVKKDNNNFILTALQISPDKEKIIEQEIQHFNNRFKQFIQEKKRILNTSKITNDIFNRIPNDKVQSKLIKDMRVEFKRHLGKLLNEIITHMTQKSIKNIQKQFSDFITRQPLDTTFRTKQKNDLQKNILHQIQKINIFEDYLNEFLQKKADELKKPIDKNIILKDITPVLKSMNDKFKDNSKKFTIKDLESYFKSLNSFSAIYYGQQLPITQHLRQFNQLIQKNDVVLVKVGTGSGKSTVIPPYLVGLGYQKVVVTQPRRLPCDQIYKRVSDVFGTGICGYEVADGGKDKNNSLIYMTDGLLKMRALYNLQVFDKIDVLIIDEIHERSANIDILLLLLNQYYKAKNRKLKLVLCSATIDKNVGKILEDANLQIATFEVNVKRHPVTEHTIQTGNILNRVLELAARLEGNQQMLVFYPGVAQVKDMVRLLNKYNHKAYPIMSQQSPIQQAQFLEIGQIFISTALAETSLTFKNLKFVVDSQMSRWRKFNPVVELMQTQEDYSSNSSIAQRKGRLGRTCPGQYHYFVYPSHDLATNRDHNRTELENNDLTSYIYELLLRQNASLKGVQFLMRKLNHNASEFDQKFQYSGKILKDLNIIDSKNSLTSSAIKMKKYGNLGHPQNNYALYLASQNNCTVDMVYLVSFLMMGINRSGEILKDRKSQAKGGDLRTIHDFIASIAEKINLNTINPKQIKEKMRQNCKDISNKPWFSVIVRVMKKAKDLLKICQSSVTISNWAAMVSTLLSAYKNKIFFNQAVFGGNKLNYEKTRKETFCFQQKEKMSDETIYKIDLNSLTYDKNTPPSIILSLNCAISPQNECVLSICEVLDLSTVKEQIKISIIGCQIEAKFFKDSQPMKEKQLFDNLQKQIQNKYNSVRVDTKFPVMELTGNFQSLSQAFNGFIQKQRRNGQLKIDLKKILEEAIAKRAIKLQKDPMLAVIKKEYSMSLLQKITNPDMKKMFQTMKFQMSNNYGIEIEWNSSMAETLFIVKNSKNLHVSKIIEKLYNFCRWFADSQTICKEQFKIKPQILEDNQFLNKNDKEKIMERVNQIVDSKLDHHIIKGWANGSGPSTKYSRTGRMLAVCWVLTNVFHCVIKGGFVRDWVVNKEEVLPIGNLRNLLKENPRNNFIQVEDESVTPSDIDAELHDFNLLDKEKFIKQMKKIGISVIIEEDGWRKHVIFDKDAQTGGFTADLIEPYTSMCHDTYDFDVNILYIKKDYLNAIGQKIPLEYQDKHGQKIKVSLEQLLSQCRKKEMRKLKQSIYQYRYTKFSKRGWKINKDEVHQPLIYTDYTTKNSPINPSSIKDICPDFYQRMVVQKKYKVERIQSLKNKAWDDAFESAQHWIITEIEKTQGGQNINSNNKLLVHGSRSNEGTIGIKQFGFDSRFFGSYGYYGRGAYFADDPQYSDAYASVNPLDNCKEMFVVMVALGKQQELTKETKQKLGPSKGFHSIVGRNRGHGEYIIERWGQAKPLYLISYRL